jgi:predicted DNA-binding transcriptional regulator AlpA
MTPKKVDPVDLIDAHVVAELLGLARSTSVAVYRKRYEDFPQPAVNMGKGRCILWLRHDIEQWARRRGK